MHDDVWWSPRDAARSLAESLYVIVTAERARATLGGVRTVIVDEIHPLARARRGSRLAWTLARLDHVVEAVGNARPARIGLSARAEDTRLLRSMSRAIELGIGGF